MATRSRFISNFINFLEDVPNMSLTFNNTYSLLYSFMHLFALFFNREPFDDDKYSYFFPFKYSMSSEKKGTFMKRI